MRKILAIITLILLAICPTACSTDLLIELEGIRIGGDYTFPTDRILENTFGLYVTDEGFDFFEDHGIELVAAFLDQESSDRLDLTEFITDFLEDNPMEIFDFTVRNIEASATFPDGPAEAFELMVLSDPTRVRVTVKRIWISFTATVYDDGGSVTSACHVAPEGDFGREELQSIELEGTVFDLVLGVSSDGSLEITSDIIELGLGRLGISVVTDPDDPNYYCNLPECQDGCFECHIFCGGAELVLDISDFFIGILEGLVQQIGEMVVNIILGGFKRIEGELHPALLLGNLVETLHDTEWFGFSLAPGGRGFQTRSIPDIPEDEGNDLFLSVSGGVDAQYHPCIGKDETEPEWFPPDPYDLEVGAERPHFVASLSDTFVDQVIWAAYKGGALCLLIDTALVTEIIEDLELNVGLVSLLLPGLDRVADDEAPLLLSILPTLSAESFPLATFGDVDGGESLINATMGQVDLGFYAWMQGRYLRLVEVRTDFDVGITPTILPDNTLELAFDRLEAELLEERYNELFQGVDLEELVNFVLGLASDILVEMDFGMAVPIEGLIEQFSGFPIEVYINHLLSEGEEARWIELAASLDSTTEPPTVERAVETTARVEHVEAGRVDLTVEAPGYRDDQIEYQIRWGFGGWRGFRPGGPGSVTSPYLSVPGTRTLEVRARAIGDYRSLDMTPVVLSIEVPEDPVADTEEPEIAATIDEPEVEGCSSAPAPRGGWPLALLVLFLLRTSRRGKEL